LGTIDAVYQDIEIYAFMTVLTPMVNKVIAKLSCGGGHTLIIDSAGHLFAVGSNYYGELGKGTHGKALSNFVFTPVDAANTYIDVAAGSGFSLAIRSDGTLWGAGRNESGQLGDGTTGTVYTRDPNNPDAPDEPPGGIRHSWGQSGALDSYAKIYAGGFDSAALLTI
jgi:alpha-tubulin suppressor-like RCC1 family protein